MNETGRFTPEDLVQVQRKLETIKKNLLSSKSIGFEKDFNRVVIQNIEAAIHKINQGTAYGICETCMTPIPDARLQMKPEAPNCMNCQVVAEKTAASQH